MEEKEIYDLIILGGGPAGSSCAIYAKKYKLNTIIISPEIGGTINKAHMVDNYLGFFDITGMDLGMKFSEHLAKFEVPIEYDFARKIEKDGDLFKVLTFSKEFVGKTILFALGLERKKLGIPGEKELLGRGVSYCVTCDAMFFRDKVVAVTGSDDHAASGAVHLAQNSSKVYLINPESELSCKPYWLDEINSNSKIQVLNETNVTEVLGAESVKGIKTTKGDLNDVEGFFIEIGAVPSDTLLSEFNVQKDDKGFIKVDSEQRTTEDGIYAAGDITTNSAKFLQVATAVSEGAICSYTIFKDLKKNARNKN
ncbi:FAD-dependent oxidoreductase [Candidatus Woesearchaeota archaeon]|nr:FAD-dependent oxidoreductase [Candidatus Woesearchaeota archaeon]